MIAQKGGKFLEHAEHELIGAADHGQKPNTATHKQKQIKLQALTSVTVCQFPLTQYSAFRRHSHIPQIHSRHNGFHSLMTCNSFRSYGKSRPSFRTNADGNFHRWPPHWQISLSGPCLFKTPSPSNFSLLSTSIEINSEEFAVGFDRFIFNTVSWVGSPPKRLGWHIHPGTHFHFHFISSMQTSTTGMRNILHTTRQQLSLSACKNIKRYVLQTTIPKLS